MTEFLVDADIAIDALAGRRDALELLSGLAPRGIAISIVTVGEIYEGAYWSLDPAGRLASYRAFLQSFDVLGLTDSIIERFAEVRAELRRRGALIPDLDVLMGVTAVHHNLALLSRNVRHLRRIPGIRIHGDGSE